MLNCIITDDEQLARTTLKALLQRTETELTVLAECEDVPSTVKAIRKLKPDIVFLDIDMPRVSGLQLLDFFEPEEIQFKLIFVTGFADYAIQALRLSAVDFLVKPVRLQELKDALNRAQQALQKDKSVDLLKYETLKNNQLDAKKRIAIATGEGLILAQLDELLYLKAEGAYTQIVLAGGDKHLVSRALGDFEHLLDHEFFLRSHRSFIVNLQRVKKVTKQNGLEMENGDEVIISLERRAQLIEQLTRFKI